MGADDGDTRTKKHKRARRGQTTARKVAGPPRHRGDSEGAISKRTGQPCTKCEQHHTQPSNGKPSCSGHRRRERPFQPCRKAPIPGGEVCDRHGGQFSIVKEKAARRVAWENTEGEVATLLQECDIPEQHPIDGLLEVVRHSGAMMRLLGYMCAQLNLEPDYRVYASEEGVVKASDDLAIYGYNHNSDQASHVLVALYGQWSDRYARACKLALDANIDERMVRNAEATTQVMYNAVEGALAAADLSADQQARFGKALAEQLRKVVGPLDMMPKKQVTA